MMTIYDALVDPTRRQILDLLRVQPRMVGELVELVGISQPGVSKHLRILREANLVRVRQDAQRRWYELDPEPLVEVYNWLEAYRPLWDERMDQLGSFLEELQQQRKEHESDE